jgi:hypothetical protein
MTNKKQCFFLETLSTKQIRKGVFWLSENSRPSGGWLAVDAIKVLENISEHEGLSLLKEVLTNEDHIAKISGAVIKLVTSKTIPTDGEGKPLLAVSPSKRFLDRLDMIPNITKMMVSPHGADEVDEWAKRNNAKYYYDPVVVVGGSSSNESQVNKTIELDPVVKVALEDMTNVINSSGQTTFPYIHKFRIVTSTLYVLNQNGYDLDPVSIGRSLVQDHNWGPVWAKLVDELAEDLRSGNKEFFRSGTGYWFEHDKNIIEKWKAKAKAKANSRI